MESQNKFLVPKIKKMELKSKLILDPADLRKGLPKSKLPQITDEGLILSLKPHKAPPAKLSVDGNLKMVITYTAQILHLKGRYVQVKFIDDYKDFWIGSLFGITVRGVKGEGLIRGCKVIGVQGQTILVQYISEGGNPIWKKIQQKVKDALDNES